MAHKPLPPLPARNTAAALHQAYLRLAAAINAATHAHDPRTRAAHATVFIQMEPDGIRLTRLAEKAVMTPQAMGELVDDLERLGYLRRVPDPADRRAKLILFTDQGVEALEVAFAAIGDVERRLAGELGDDTVAELNRTLARIVATD
ncbi:MarR family transcriptional regulator [Amycolatopsis rhabdoformis]|uniref:MarR family transcriptional regulator n=1 Tax=Amycolatopsis rhabdoformis TaxID=1448059 RepID=A0ABZ1IKM0_9PSEU|nr:MarR family transcriptional regulator [Amycolatopsis rhabdoformis]WSE34323.1 MarR family transcriptional regulator [Amycolatopsis rhabdoformis]